MYEAFYGLTTSPFKLNPDPSFYFASKQHQRARAYLEYGVSRNEGFIVITGEIGAGKTTVLRGLLDTLQGSSVVVGHIVTTQLDDQDVLRMVGAAFGVAVKDQPKSMVLGNIEAFLVTQAAQGRRCLLVIDEAQNLTPRAVEELRMLSNFHLGQDCLLQSFLVGQPEFRHILQQADMEQFRQRVAATCHIGPLDEEDTRAYIQHRLKAAGSTGLPSFDEDVYAIVHAATGGVPRRINSLLDRLLLSGFLSETSHFGCEQVEEVAQEIREEGLVRSPASAVHDEPPRGVQVPVLREVLFSRDSDPERPNPWAHARPQQLQQALAALDLGEQSARLDRLEEGLQRLEQINRESLMLMRRMVQLMGDEPPAAEPISLAASNGTGVV